MEILQILQSNFTEITLRYRCSPVDLLHIFRTPFPKNNSRQLLLYLEHSAVVDVQKRRKQNKEISNKWYKRQEKREEQELQNTLTLTAGRNSYKKSQLFHEYE